MPSVDHCLNTLGEMATVTNSIEVFDAYKPREDKDSDEESFHLRLDEDDEQESRPQSTLQNGKSDETEEDILDKFEFNGLDSIDLSLEEHLLNDEEDKKSVNSVDGKIDGIAENELIENLNNGNLDKFDNTTNANEMKQAKAEESTKNDNVSASDAVENKKVTESTTEPNKSDNINDKPSGKPVETSKNNKQKQETVEVSKAEEGEVEKSEKDTLEDLDDGQSLEENKDSAPSGNILDTSAAESTEIQECTDTESNSEITRMEVDQKDNNAAVEAQALNEEKNTELLDNEPRTTENKELGVEEEMSKKDLAEDKGPAVDEKDDASKTSTLDSDGDDIKGDVEKMDIDEPEEKEKDKTTDDSASKENLKSADEITNTNKVKTTESRDNMSIETKENKTDKYNIDETSRDSVKDHNEDSEELFDISVIRDANEDNAESAYNEAHPEGSEDGDDRNSEKEEKSEDDINSDDKTDNIEEEEVMIDHDKQDSEHLQREDVDIEESNLRMDCVGASKDGVSDVDSEKTNDKGSSDGKAVTLNTSETEKQKTVVNANLSEVRLDEVTGDLIANGKRVEVCSVETPTTDTTDSSEKRKSLKRTVSEDSEFGTAKKYKTDQTSTETQEAEKLKEKPPVKCLLSLADFMRKKKANRRLTTHDLEEFCLQKICEAIAYKSDLGSLHHQLKLQDQLIETMRKEIQQLTKQARDLEIVNKKLMNDLKQNSTQKPLAPLKITRSVGLQVKFTPTCDIHVKRRQPTLAAPVAHKCNAQVTAARGPKNIPNNTTTPTRQVNSPQKPVVLPKPNTPLLSQALQSTRRVPNDIANRSNTQTVRPKASDPKTPTASVIDLTDEDDKAGKNKTSPKTITTKNIAVPIRTTPVRVNATATGIRLATTQGKISPMTSMVTNTTPPQVMYVVQSPGQSGVLNSKAVVVNFQSANGVITSMNGSMIQNKGNTIQLKTVTPAKAVTNNKIVKLSHKHPAPLPPPPVIRVTSDKPLRPIPPKPHLTIRKTDTGIILQWKMPYDLDMYEVIASYQLYAYQETSAMPSTDMWRKVGDVKALALPMACTLTQFADKNKYYFAVRPVDILKRIGVFSEPEEISL